MVWLTGDPQLNMDSGREQELLVWSDFSLERSFWAFYTYEKGIVTFIFHMWLKVKFESSECCRGIYTHGKSPK